MIGTRVVIVHPPEWVKRSWRNRLFSRPWRPMVSHHRTYNSARWELVAANGCGVTHDGVLYCTQEFWTRLKRNSKASAFPDLSK